MTDHVIGFIARTHIKDKRRTSEVTTPMYNLAVATGKTKGAARYRAGDRIK
jgi:hypothetical protein